MPTPVHAVDFGLQRSSGLWLTVEIASELSKHESQRLAALMQAHRPLNEALVDEFLAWFQDCEIFTVIMAQGEERREVDVDDLCMFLLEYISADILVLGVTRIEPRIVIDVIVHEPGPPTPHTTVARLQLIVIYKKGLKSIQAILRRYKQQLTPAATASLVSGLNRYRFRPHPDVVSQQEQQLRAQQGKGLEVTIEQIAHSEH